MRKLGHFFPEQHDDEEIVVFTHRHWVVFFDDMVFSVVMLLAYAVVLGGFIYAAPILLEPENLRLVYIISAIVIMITVLRVFVSWVDYYLDVWILTNERVVEIKQHALFNRQISEMQIEDVEDVSAKVVGIFGTMFKFGTIFVQTAGATDLFEFLRVPRPYEIQKQILRMRNLYEEKTKKEIGQMVRKTRTQKGLQNIKPLFNYIDSKVINPHD